jgi:hypothetical protein
MITQKALKLEKVLNQRDILCNRNLMRLYMNQTWVTTKIARFKRRSMLKDLQGHALATFGMRIHAINRQKGKEWDWG